MKYKFDNGYYFTLGALDIPCEYLDGDEVSFCKDGVLSVAEVMGTVGGRSMLLSDSYGQYYVVSTECFALNFEPC